ncbi:hypothetical protein F5887DRAFT_988426 [Amanita rubescens]|nr:hypothetical protein F5887DRAFT_1147343 [Amanita rubescens]KAF8336049.1 hypothetical protein F5887DRAFT_988426 [Amanita rubescens]
MSPKSDLVALFVPLLFYSLRVYAHQSIWNPAMWGFNVTSSTFSYDNRPVVPLMNRTFAEWWFHGHLDYPPAPGDIIDLPAGQDYTFEIACDKGYTSWWNSSSGGDVISISEPESPCPGQSTAQFHTLNEADATGCALGIVYNSDVNSIKPEEFTIFSVNHTCVWSLHTNFEIPADMPACPNGKCTCAWFWIHSPYSGSEQMYMNGFACNIVGSKPDAPALATPQVARRCGYDKYNNVPANPSNCTYGAKQPLYWKQAEGEGNNMFEGAHSPPLYNDLYHFLDGAQNDIFVNSTTPSRRSADDTETAVNTASDDIPKRMKHVRLGHSVGL